MKRFIIAFVVVLTSATAPAHAQFGSGIVFDPTQSGHAIAQISQAKQLYTTALDTRNTIVAAYNLSQQMANLPQALYRQYATPWTRWQSISAANIYGNVDVWITAANTGSGAVRGYQEASLPATAYPFYDSLDSTSRRLIASQAATSDLSDAISEADLQTLGSIRQNSQARDADIRTLEAATYSSDPTQHTQMATLQRLNQAALMQLRTEQEANQIHEALALEQLVAQKQQQDALKAGFADAAQYQQEYATSVAPLTANFSSSLRH